MLIPDINILIYAINKDSYCHEKAKQWLEETLSGPEPIGFAWIVLLGFMRITTHEKILPYPLSSEAACEIIDSWLERPNIRIVAPEEDHWNVLKELCKSLGTAGNLTSDAHLAALTIENNGVLCSTDNDFSRFSNLRWKNPIAD